jgi:hypothetical protein
MKKALTVVFLLALAPFIMASSIVHAQQRKAVDPVYHRA